MSTCNKPLTREQKEAIGLLSIGTFLEYFDMMLYVHMGVILNALFFPKTDPHTTMLLSAFAFCSTYVFRPIGALLFGYIGDHIGRKCTIIITTAMMAVSCFIMAITPIYDQIGIAASVAMISCRILQSLAATGELMGAEIYLTEILKPPKSYMIVSWITEMCLVGGSLALLVGIVILKLQLSWRLIFLTGSIIALVGTSARTRLKETVEFADLQRRAEKISAKYNEDGWSNILKKLKRSRSAHNYNQEPVNWRTMVAYFFVYCGGPMCFYITYVYGGEMLKRVFNYSPEQVMIHNLKLNIVAFFSAAFLIILSKYIKPLVLIKYRAIIFLLLSPLISFVINDSNKNIYLFSTIQVLSVMFSVGQLPAAPILFQHFPIFKRFTYSSLLYSLSRAIMYVITSIGLVYIVKAFHDWGILMLSLPISICFLWGVAHFQKLELAIEQALSLAKPFKKRILHKEGEKIALLHEDEIVSR